MLDDCQYSRVAESVTANVQQFSANDCFAQNVKECGQCKARQAQFDNNWKISSNLGLCVGVLMKRVYKQDRTEHEWVDVGYRPAWPFHHCLFTVCKAGKVL